MRKINFIIILVLSILLISAADLLAVDWKTQESGHLSTADLLAGNWKTQESDHFIVYYINDEKNAKDTLDKAEKYYDNIAVEIGYPRYSGFWSWDKKVRIYIYRTHEEFLKATKQPDWSHGMANYTDKYIAGYEWSEEFLNSVLPHEITHLIFRDFVGFTGKIRIWLDEGVAQWCEEKRRESKKAYVRQLYATDRLLRLEDLVDTPLKAIKEKGIYIKSTLSTEGEVTVLIIDGESFVDIYYAQSFSIIGFLIERYGSTRFSDFCRQLRDGKTLVQALNHAYPDHINSLDDLEKKWREYLKEDYKNHGG